MKTPIRRELLDHPDAQRFVETAREICKVVESLDEMSEAEFLGKLDRLLPLLYSYGLSVPDPYDWDAGDDDLSDDDLSSRDLSAVKLDMFIHWNERIRWKLGDLDVVQLAPDRTETDGKSVPESLGRLISDIYVDLAVGLSRYDSGVPEEQAEALWDWMFGVKLDWGWNASASIRPIHQLVHVHYDEDAGRFDI